jgi:2-hydroxy-3-oxopropionate reductase
MNALDTAKELGSPAILTSKVLEILQTLKVEGKGKNDHSGLIQYYEKMANVEVRKKK